MVRIRSTLEIEVLLPILAGPEDAPVPGTAVPHNKLIEPRNSGDTIPIRTTTNQVLCSQNAPNALNSKHSRFGHGDFGF
jgi:hypothetical protein